MAAHPPSDPGRNPEAPRPAIDRRNLAFGLVALLLLLSSVWLVLRIEQRRAEPPPAAPAPPPITVPAPEPAPPGLPAEAPPATSPALRQSEQMAEALAAYREAEAHLVARRIEQAEDRALAALRAYPGLPGAQRILGLVYLQQGRIDRAIDILESSLRNEPFHPQAMTDLSMAYLQNRNPGLALELIETCRRLHPDYKPAVIQHGLILLSQPDSAPAIDVLREAVAAFPDAPGPRNNLAVALARRGDHEEARSQLEQILEFDPDNFTAMFNLGALFARITNAPAAVPWLRRAMAKMPPDQFREFLNDPDLAPIRETGDFRQLLRELDPDFPGPPPGP